MKDRKTSVYVRGYMRTSTIGAMLIWPMLGYAADSSVATIYVAAVDAQASEIGVDPGAILLTREGGKIEAPLTVAFTLSGSATPGVDYVSPATSVTFTPYSPLVSVSIKPLKDALVEGTESVVLTVGARPGVYAPGEDKSATVTIADANSPTAAPAEIDPRKLLPPPDRTGTLTATVTLDGAGKWSNPRNGAYSDLKFHREMSYNMALNGKYEAGSGFVNIDRREFAGPVVSPNMRRFLVLTPRDAFAPAGTPCARGTSAIRDDSSGMEVGDPGQPPLIPFVQTVKGGGAFPSGDKTVPERDLCESAVTFDLDKHVFHLRIDGSDAHVKVTNVHNGFTAPTYNLRLHGDDADKARLTFFDVPMPASAETAGIEGTRFIKDFGYASGPGGSSFPLQATVKWKVTMQK